MKTFLLTCPGVVVLTVTSLAAPYPEGWTVGIVPEDVISSTLAPSGAREPATPSSQESPAYLPLFTYEDGPLFAGDDKDETVQLAARCIPGWERWQCLNSCIADLGRCETACLLGPTSELSSCQLGCMEEFRTCRRRCSAMAPPSDETGCTPRPY